MHNEVIGDATLYLGDSRELLPAIEADCVVTDPPYSCPPGGLVLDCFGGSFSTGVAALQLGRRFVGIEVDQERFSIGCKNLEDSLRQERLFA